MVHFDEATGEKHIADVKTRRGLVIELQNSPMPLDELRARESFYKRMIWIVNAKNWHGRLFVLDALPAPKAVFVRDLVFFARQYDPKLYCPGGFFWRRSENPELSGLVLLHSVEEIKEDIQRSHIGHHLFDWHRPRTVWYEASAPVFLDPGGSVLWRLLRYDDRGLWCVKRVWKDRLVAATSRCG